MATAASRKLKVFQAQFGFFESVVAASSQTAALRAWDTHQNLFADGQARVATDPRAIEAALAQPGTPLKRAIGSIGAFELASQSLPVIPDAPKPKARRQEMDTKPPPSRKQLDRAEAELRGLEEDRKAQEEEFRRRQTSLDQDRADAQRSFAARQKAAKDRVAEERAAFRDAGGQS